MLLGLFSAPALSAPKDVIASWNSPTTREDGSPLSVDEIAHYLLLMTAPSGSSSTTTVNKEFNQYVFYGLDQHGIYSLNIYTEDTGGRVSKPSVSVDVFVSNLSPPTNGRIDPPTNGSIDP